MRYIEGPIDNLKTSSRRILITDDRNTMWCQCCYTIGSQAILDRGKQNDQFRLDSFLK